ncbi:hypothetical protein J3R83DRAFT_4501 [Lanmaoa asiatica]|nr:hypothetical protein J3R83DRAFT_4501 [Lanmaoa asiatica]
MPLAPSARTPLLVAELFYAILDFLAEPSRSESSYDIGIQIRTPDPDGRRALAALARTCRGFLEPSLNHLWCKLNSLEPLIRCYFTQWTAVLAGRQALVGELFPELKSCLTSTAPTILKRTGLSSTATPIGFKNLKSRMTCLAFSYEV